MFRTFGLLAPNTGNPEQNKNTTDHYNEAMSVRLSHFCKIFNPALHISW
jgi:hypothetical protein